MQEYDFRGLQISKTNHKCILFGEELSLTPLEFSILWYLCEKRGQVVSSEELFEAVWGEKYFDSCLLYTSFQGHRLPHRQNRQQDRSGIHLRRD